MKRIKTSKTGVYYNLLQDNDKVYYITYKDSNQNKKVWVKIGKYSEGIRENYCVQKRNEALNIIRLGEEPPIAKKNKRKKRILLEDISEQYFTTRKEGRSKDIDKQSFDKHLNGYFYDLDLVKKEDVEKLKKELKLKKNQQDEPLSDKTVNNILTLLGSIVKYGIKENLLTNDISKFINKFKQLDNKRERFLSKEEIQELYEYLKKENDDRLYLFSRLALGTGGRLATILNIKKQDIDFEHQMITLKDFKNNTTYKNPLSRELLEELRYFSNNLKYSDHILWDRTSINKALLNVLNELFNLGKVATNDRKNKVVIHTLRHTFASHLAINGTPIYTIQKLMNHKDINMTLRYAKLAPDSGRESIEGLGF